MCYSLYEPTLSLSGGHTWSHHLDQFNLMEQETSLHNYMICTMILNLVCMLYRLETVQSRGVPMVQDGDEANAPGAQKMANVWHTGIDWPTGNH